MNEFALSEGEITDSYENKVIASKYKKNVGQDDWYNKNTNEKGKILHISSEYDQYR